MENMTMKHLMYLVEDAINGINNGNSEHMEVDKGRAEELMKKGLGKGILILFSLTGEVQDVLYTDDISNTISNLSLIKRKTGIGVAIHSIRDVPCEKEAYKMILSGLKLILGKYDEC